MAVSQKGIWKSVEVPYDINSTKTPRKEVSNLTNPIFWGPGNSKNPSPPGKNALPNEKI